MIDAAGLLVPSSLARSLIVYGLLRIISCCK